MGFSRIIMPTENRTFKKWGGDRRGYQKSQSSLGIECVECDTLRKAINAGLVSPIPKRSKRKPRRNKQDSSQEISHLGLDGDNDDEFIIDDSEDYDEDGEGLSFQ